MPAEIPRAQGLMKFLRDLSIQYKLMVIVLLTSSVALILAGIAFAVYDLTTFRLKMVDDVSILAESIGINSSAALSFGVQGSGEEILQLLKAQPHVVAAAIYSAPDGKMFAHYKRDKGAFTPPALEKEGHR